MKSLLTFTLLAASFSVLAAQPDMLPVKQISSGGTFGICDVKVVNAAFPLQSQTLIVIDTG